MKKMYLMALKAFSWKRNASNGWNINYI